MPGSFLDTNVVAYLTLDQGAKSEKARGLVETGATISVQVLNELANVARRKRSRPWQDVLELLATLQGLLAVEPLTVRTHTTGIAIAERYQLSIYDAMIVASAILSGCDTLWSEDMHDGLVIDSALTVRNPFAGLS